MKRKSSRSGKTRRHLVAQTLERRDLLAGDIGHNFVEPEDVNLDGYVSARDALNVINHLAAQLNSNANGESNPQRATFLADVDASCHVSVGDALRVINQIARGERNAAVIAAGTDRLASAILTEDLPDGMRPQTADAWFAKLEERLQVPNENRGAFKRLDSDGDGGISANEVNTEVWEQISGADSNGNGTVTDDELKGNRPAEGDVQRPQGAADAFAHLDANDDGALSPEEVSSHVWSRISLADTDGNGAVDVDELNALRVANEEQVRRPNPEEAFARLDANEDHSLTADELTAQAWSNVSHADLNEDGMITLDELQSARQAIEEDVRRPSPDEGFSRLDLNQDGKLGADEVSEHVWAKLSKVDASQDGMVTLEELATARDENEANVRRPGPEEAFADLDADEDGRLTSAELNLEGWVLLAMADGNSDDAVELQELIAARISNEQSVQKPNPEASLNRLDVNQDNQLTSDEISESVWTRLSNFDANSDGGVTLVELELARAAIEESVRKPNPNAAFADLDLNEDTKLSSDEVSAEAWSQLSKADTNVDGYITLEELADARHESEINVRSPNPDSGFAELDANDDGKLTAGELSETAWERLSGGDANADSALTLEELKAARIEAEQQVRKPNPNEVFAELDLNQDQRLSGDEVSDDLWTRFSKKDANEDGAVTLQELAAARVDDETNLRRPSPGNALAELDANDDGRVTSDEVTDETWAKLSFADENSDAAVSLEELTAARVENEERIQKPNPVEALNFLDVNEDFQLTADELSQQVWVKFSKVDANADGAVTLDELAAAREANEERLLRPKPQEVFAELDINNDGKLTFDEVSLNAWSRLSTSDANQDGAATVDELIAERVANERQVRKPDLEEAFAALDLNNDEKLTSDEIHVDTWTKMVIADATGDSAVTIQELRASREINERQIREPDPAEAFALLDVNEDSIVSADEVTFQTWAVLAPADSDLDGGVTLAEIIGWRERNELEVRKPSFDEAFYQLDLNVDGKLTSDEVTEGVWPKLELLDADNDGAITLGELLFAREHNEREIQKPHPDEVFAKLDVSEDGKLTPDELSVALWSKLSGADTDNDGSLTLKELNARRDQNELEVRKPNPEDSFAQLDVDGDGLLASAEVTTEAWAKLSSVDANQDRAVTVAELLAARVINENNVVDPEATGFLTAFAELDVNNDGGLTADEVRSQTWTILSAADANKDGVVTAEEIENKPEDITELVKEIFDGSNLPALSGGIIDGDGIRAIGVAGVRQSGGSDPVETDELWHLGSITKAMTATLYATFVRDEELSFDDTLSDLFPNLTIDPGFANVTPRQLLAHRGGAPAQVFPAQWSQWWAGGDVQTLRADWARILLGSPPPATVGEYTYSNGGYVIVGAVMEAHTGKSWEQLMAERLFEPLGMDRCGFGPTPAGSAVGHDSSGTPRPGADNPPTLGPAGTVHCDLKSWGKFVAANLVGPDGGSPLLPAALWNELHEPLVGSYALGWGVTDRGWANGLTLTHTGSNTMWYAVVWAAPNIDRAFVAITNTTAPDASTVGSTLDTLIWNMIQHDALNSKD